MSDKWISKKYSHYGLNKDCPSFENKCPECDVENKKTSGGLNWTMYDCDNSECRVKRFSDVGYYV